MTSCAAHPRSRGENSAAAKRRIVAAGSSPLTRGKRHFQALNNLVLRLIPAHAGKTTGAPHATTWWPAHPRSRGENIPPGPRVVRVEGSSPLTRGKPLLPLDPCGASRLIPAHAGKTIGGSLSPLPMTAHPRSRGENLSPSSWSHCRRGSSPLTRGKRIAKIAKRALGRLIPAHAGKTISSSRMYQNDAAHPRSRGENLSVRSPVASDSGSSPLTRGKPSHQARRNRGPGLIPAHAGKTRCLSRSTKCLRAHPRSRGENSLLTPMLSDRYGSSPLTRGKPGLIKASFWYIRLIPAHAGKTSDWRHRHGDAEAHPRSRGENFERYASKGSERGSSPLTRGKQPCRQAARHPRGLIPAHAGKTA